MYVQVPHSTDGRREPRGIVFAWGRPVLEVLSLQRAT